MSEAALPISFAELAHDAKPDTVRVAARDRTQRDDPATIGSSTAA
jgi:hypothetical protein